MRTATLTRLSGSTALVTGGAGFIGSHLVDALLFENCKVKILDSVEAYVHPDGLPSWVPTEASIYIGHVQDRIVLEKALQDVDYIFHEAAFTGSPHDYSRYTDANVNGTALMYELIAKNHIPVKKVVVASSQAVYGEGKYHCGKHSIQYPCSRSLEQLQRHDWTPKCQQCGSEMLFLPTDEEAAKNGATAYAISKYAQERLSLALGLRIGIPTVALRYAVTYGPRQSYSNVYAGVVAVFASRIVNGLPPVVYEDGFQVRDWIHVGDVVRANLLVAENNRANFEVLNVGTGKATSVRDVAEIIAEELGSNIKPQIPGEFRPEDIRNLILDVSKLASLGFKAEMNFKEGIRSYIDWFKLSRPPREFYSEAEEYLKTSGIVMS